MQTITKLCLLVYIVMSIQKIIITAPHVVCRKSYRDCDRRAREAAMRIYEAIPDRFHVSLHLSNLYRRDYDGNRVSSRKTPWREEVTRDIQESVKRYGAEHVLLLDIHSMVGLSKEYARRGDDAMPMLCTISYDDRISTLRDRLEAALGKVVTAFRGGARFDLISEARDHGVVGILIEHNENHDLLTSEDIDKEIQVLIPWIDDLPTIQPSCILGTRRPGPEEIAVMGQPVAVDTLIQYGLLLLVLIIVLIWATAHYYLGERNVDNFLNWVAHRP